MLFLATDGKQLSEWDFIPRVLRESVNKRNSINRPLVSFDIWVEIFGGIINPQIASPYTVAELPLYSTVYILFNDFLLAL